MLGEFTGVENRPERNVHVEISEMGLSSAIAEPQTQILPESVKRYELAESHENGGSIWDLRIVTSSGAISFYRTKSKFDLALLLDELDGTIGERERVIATANV